MTRIKTLEELNSIGYKEFSNLEDIVIDIPESKNINNKATAEAWGIIKNKGNNYASGETYATIGGVTGFISGVGLTGYFEINRNNASFTTLALTLSCLVVGGLCDRYFARKESRKIAYGQFLELKAKVNESCNQLGSGPYRQELPAWKE